MFTNYTPVALPGFDAVADIRTILQTTPWPIHNVQGYGAKADGVTDDGPAIRAALVAAAATGGTVEFPGGPGTVYVLGPSGATYSATLAPNVTIRGSGATIRRKSGNAEKMLGAATALTDVAVRDLTLDNGDAAVFSGGVLYVPSGSTRIAVERVRFVGLAAAGAVLVDQGNTQSTRIRVLDCHFLRTLANGTAGAENINTVQILDASDVRIEGCRFENVNGLQLSAQTAAACPSTTPMRGIYLVGCTFERVKTTSVFVQTNAVAVHVQGVHLLGNTFLNVGKEIEKGAFSILHTGSGALRDVQIRGNVIRDFGYAGSSTIGATTNAAQAITIGGNAIDGMTIADNQIDGASQAGTVPAGGNYGVDVGTGVSRLVIRGNVCRNLGHDGIRLSGASGFEVTRVVVADNVVVGCCLYTPVSGFTAGIHLVDYVLYATINGNLCLDNGAAGMAAFQAAGIGVDQPSGVTVAQLVVDGNACFDTRAGGSKLQKYGILLGRAGNLPSFLTVVGNSVDGNLTAGLVVANFTDQQIAQNRGYLTATAASTMTGVINAGTTAVQSVTVTGAVFGDQVVVGHTGVGTGVDGLVLSARVVLADTVRVMLSNVTAGALTGPAGDLRISVHHYRGAT